jgi:hypothetical protein
MVAKASYGGRTVKAKVTLGLQYKRGEKAKKKRKVEFERDIPNKNSIPPCSEIGHRAPKS